MHNENPCGQSQPSLLMTPSQDRSLLFITIGVLAMHCLAFLLTYLDSANAPPPPPPPAKRLVVQTVALQEHIPQRPLPTFEEPEPPPPPPPEPEPEPVKIVQPEPPPPEPTPAPQVAEIEPPAPVEPEKSKPEPEKPKPPEKQKVIEPEKPKPVEKKKPKVPEKKKPKPAPAPKKKTPPAKKPEPKKPVKKAPEPSKPKKDPAPKEKPKQVAETPPKPKEAPKTAPKPSPPKPDPKIEAANAKKRALLEQAQKSIAKIGQSRDKIGAVQTSAVAEANVPAQIESLHVEALVGDPSQSLSKQEVGYQDELAGRLKLLLRMPEYGEVKIKLTLDRAGKYVKVAIVSAESSANRKHVEKTLPTLSYPSFGNNFGSEPQYTFVIVLSNDM